MVWFFNHSLSYPTIVYSILLGVALCYWLTVALGVVKINNSSAAAENRLYNVLYSIGLSGVPVNVALSILLVWSWLLAFVLASLALLSLSAAQTLFGDVLAWFLLPAALLGSIYLTRVSIKPLQKHFITPPKKANKTSVIGKICRITSGAVDERFGEAEYVGDGETIALHVRCQAPTRLRRGESALITEYEVEKEVYWVSTYQDPLV